MKVMKPHKSTLAHIAKIKNLIPPEGATIAELLPLVGISQSHLYRLLRANFTLIPGGSLGKAYGPGRKKGRWFINGQVHPEKKWFECI